MNFAHIEYFLAVAHAKKFSTAAEHAYVSQSCLSKQIKALEEELGVELFIRSPGGVTLTPAGEMFLDFSQKTHRDYERIIASLAQYNQAATRRIRVGALPLMGEYRLHPALADFQVDNMDVQIDFYERNQGEIISRLEMDRLDVAILRTDLLDPEEYDWVPLVVDEVVVICAVGHPLARKLRVGAEDFRDERFVALEEHSAITRVLRDRCRAAGFSPNITYTHTRHEPLVAAVSRNVGISVLPRGLTQPDIDCGIVRIQLQNPGVTEIGLVTPKKRELSPLTRKLVDHFKMRYPEPVRVYPSATQSDT